MAVEPQLVKTELDKLFADIRQLNARSLSLNIEEFFYYASMLHLLFEKIHPFMDGNRRAGRLLEKWFLSVNLGKEAWAIPSEKYYAKNRDAYYRNIHIGVDYYHLKMENCLPFLWMLPQALNYEK